MGDLFNTFLSSIKFQFNRFLNKIRTITSKTYIKNKVWGRIKQFFTDLFDVKPKDKNDYYGIFSWLVSKRLAYLLVIVVGIVSASYIYTNRVSLFHLDKESIKSYNYSSILLRFAKGEVRIKGKGGYLAYEGNVEKGQVKGKGKLYDHSENLLYEGDFDYNEYNGEGRLYYSNGIVNYEGAFVDNLFEGYGTLYRPSGNIWYEGDFKKGLKDGEGSLRDVAGNKIYKGLFAADNLVYSALLGMKTEEIAGVYTGQRILYEGEDYFNVYLKDIDAIYEGISNDGALDDSIKVNTVYVLQNHYETNIGSLTGFSQLRSYFGEPIYYGESNLTQSEALAVYCIRKERGDELFTELNLQTTRVFDDDYIIDSYDTNKTVYIESFSYGGLEYTFVGNNASEDFGFYYISG